MESSSSPLAYRALHTDTAAIAATPAYGLRRHIPALDGLRGFAVILVMLLHFIGNTTPTNRFEAVLGYVLGHGMLGVELFFLLSGFLITGILYDDWKKPNYYRNFYVRRVLRIFPLYYGTLFLLFVVIPLIPGLRSAALEGLHENQAWVWLYGVNIFHALQGEWGMTYLNHFWSLAVEEHFYFAWPLLVGALRSRPRALLWTSLAISMGSYAGNVAVSALGASATFKLITPLQLHGLALGGFLAVLVKLPGGLEHVLRWIPRLAAIAATALLATFSMNHLVGAESAALGHLRPLMFLVILACLLMWAVTAPGGSPVARILTSRVMVFFGTYSYGLYVFHHFVSFYFIRHETEFALAERLGSHTVAVFVQALGGSILSIAIAYLSYHLFEKRFLVLKRRFTS